ncbi:UPF0149 family protein [Oceanobacter mangrovi]|uniref:UPF0149 family protein n=1 Tax=Oceanobacter mangrovi TaxID=2862510 RepID=UPI001C8E3405|nr:UPF0149 family protein [Oceanobacter mangrovi]
MKIDFANTADLWLESRCYQSPSALHGWLSGYLSSGARLTQNQWMNEALDYLELEEEPSEQLVQTLRYFYDDVLATISAEEMAYAPLLPKDDESDVVEQVECLAEWSKGFLDGFGASERAAGQLPKDVLEVLNDLDAFSQAQLEDENDPSNEAMYLELAEHARIAALTVFYSMNRSASGTNTTLH